jgi:hypothetical protein
LQEQIRKYQEILSGRIVFDAIYTISDNGSNAETRGLTPVPRSPALIPGIEVPHCGLAKIASPFVAYTSALGTGPIHAIFIFDKGCLTSL